VFLLVVTALLPVGTGAGAGAQEAEGPPPGVDPGLWAAATDGPVRVVVALQGVEEVATSPPGDASDQAQQLAEVDEVQAEVGPALEATGDGEVVDRFESVPGLVAEVGQEGLAQLAADPEVVAITEDEADQAHLASSVPAMGAPGAWAKGFDGSGGNVAVLDTGIDDAHPRLSGHVVANLCFSSDGTGPTGNDSACPNGGPVQIGQAPPCGDAGCEHGTHVGATVSSLSTGGGSGNGAGVAPGAGIVDVLVFGNDPDGLTSSLISDQVAALDHLFTNRVALDLVAVNMSLGGTAFSTQGSCDASDPTRKAAIGQLRSAGIPVVVASGNDGLTSQISRPACFSTSISVGATDDALTVASFSNNDGYLALLGPGRFVCSAVPTTENTNDCGPDTATFEGTSVAAPHVAGAFAILREAFPTATTNQLLQRLKDSGTPVTDSRPGASGNVTPFVQVDDALSTFLDVPPGHPFFDDIEWMAAEGISTGFLGDLYKPADAVTRQAMSAFMYRLAGEPAFTPPGSPTFSDVPLGHPFFDEIEWMADEEITTGFSGGIYKPSEAVSRQAMSAFMRRLDEGPGVGI